MKKNNVTKDVTIKESLEIESPTEDESRTDWFDKNKFKNVLAIADSNKFNNKNKIGEFKYNDIKDLVNNINKNTNREILARQMI